MCYSLNYIFIEKEKFIKSLLIGIIYYFLIRLFKVDFKIINFIFHEHKGANNLICLLKKNFFVIATSWMRKKNVMKFINNFLNIKYSS